jgi:RimJ/RimL family protein N-acetyltransferase
VAVDLGRLGVAYWMEDLRITVVHGIILSSNQPAINYAKRLGFREVATVPDWRYVHERLEPVTVVQVRDDEFMPGFERWFESKKL